MKTKPIKRRREPSPLSSWRKKHGLTLEEVCDLTGASMPMLCRVERGERYFSAFARVQMARALGVKIRELFPVQKLVFRKQAGKHSWEKKP